MNARPEEMTQLGGLAKHRILLELGQGGMSNVYLAVARGPGDFHKLLVLKVLRADLAQDETFRTMAFSEARIAARLSHTNVVQTYEVLNEGARPVIVMEYLDGQSLSSVLSRARDGSFTLAMALQILIDALAGLHHAHELSDYDGAPFGLVHRDFTPHNIFLGYDGHVRIIDFGIAKTEVVNADSNTGTIKGKVRYMSPEQILATPPIDRRADIFAAGMVLWELAMRESPWKTESEIAVINHVINAELPAMHPRPPGVPADIERIFTRATQFDREARYATAAEMAAELEQVLTKLNARVLPRDLGRVVCQHFGEARSETQRVIEEQLAASEHGLESYSRLAVPYLHTGEPADRTERASLPPPPSRTKSRPVAFWAAPAALALVGLGVALTLSLRRRDVPEVATIPSAPSLVQTATSAASPSTPATPPTPAAPSTPAVPPRVEIEVRATPPSAAIYFDEERLPGNPANTTHPADGTIHTVRAEAPGYQTRTTQIVVDKGADLVLNLDRAAAIPSHNATAPTHGSGVSDCSPPYFIDADGIKKFKPQCL